MMHSDKNVSCLHFSLEDVIINHSEVVTEELMKYLDKERKVATICDLTKIKKHSRDNRLYVYINRRQFIAPTRKELVEKIYREFFGAHMSTLRDTYLLFINKRIENHEVGKTTKEYRDYWNRFLENHPIANMVLADITISDLDSFFSFVTARKDIRVKTFSNLKTLVNQIFDYAMMDMQIISSSPVRCVDSKKFRKRCLPTQKREGYTNDERLTIKNYLRDHKDMYSLAIRFAFDTYLRIGELSAIKLDDIVGNNVRIHYSQRRVVEVSEDLKSTKCSYEVEERLKSDDPGKTYFLPLTNEQMDIVSYIKENYPQNEYLFMERGHPIIANTFNDHLKRVCNHLGITYHSSHCIRFTNATYLSQQGVALSDISSLLNHTKVTTTALYINVNKISPSVMETSRHLLA